MSDVPRACRREGHGPSTGVRRRVWWAPWRTYVVVACWVCHTPLTPDEADQADARWLPVFEGAAQLLRDRKAT